MAQQRLCLEESVHQNSLIINPEGVYCLVLVSESFFYITAFQVNKVFAAKYKILWRLMC